MAERPTDSARAWFGTAADLSKKAAIHTGDVANTELALAVNHMALGLADLSQGLRATYILLEEVQRSVKSAQGFGAGRPG